MSWDHIRGHEHVAEAFRHVVRTGHLAHAYLFVGPSGVGKQTFARELGKAILCERRTVYHFEACGQCPSCLLFAAGNHSDFIYANRPEDKLEIPVATVRELCRALSLKPARGGRKIAVLDEADSLNEDSANCLLKTLEEPPQGSVLILIGSTPDRQLPTIVSRCQVIRFAPLQDEVMQALLGQQGVTDAALRERLMRLGQGSPGDALALAEPGLWDFRRRFLTDLIRTKPDTVTLATSWIGFVEESGKEAGAQRQRASLVLRLLIEFLRDALALSVGAETRSLSPDERAWAETLAKRLGTEGLLGVLNRTLEAGYQVERRVQLVLILEALTDALGRRVAAPV